MQGSKQEKEKVADPEVPLSGFGVLGHDGCEQE